MFSSLWLVQAVVWLIAGALAFYDSDLLDGGQCLLLCIFCLDKYTQERFGQDTTQ